MISIGNVLSVTDPDGHTITYSYDADNEVTGETWVNPSGGSPLDVFDYTYNADGELTAVSDNNSAYQYTYNADGEVTSQADVGSPDLPTVTLTYDYDADGNRTSMDDSLGGLVSFTYNARDELTNETLLRLGDLGRGGEKRLRQRRQHDRPDPLFQPGGDDRRGVDDVCLRQCRADDRDHGQELRRHHAGLVCLHVQCGRAGERRKRGPGLRAHRPTR